MLPADTTFLLIYEFYRKMYILRENSILQSCTVGKFMYSSNYIFGGLSFFSGSPGIANLATLALPDRF